ncbi:membrane fusion protein, multidrug efflux system [Tistlia consotensis]|uniref:Membrane fusion protein, multidrug efflux system n=1 Tax=Tistlia consotensis USBA 355 TaxID=560819 RepID=A0A1Y6CU43_9PROT|nr:efflux RND transporter periplasmic adaptor subunit [Tistlia consotensis]SMF77242.1 membrane fusion protein, multidrug efflux system [Tistlia consotensis USBA 355]SNS14524.1 membrane fusion protein, multidrug efflux system [Tistlia consotensis]
MARDGVAQASTVGCRLGAVLAALLLAAAPGASPAAAQQRAGPAVPVIVKPVERTTFYDRVEAVGSLKANETVILSANVSERIVELLFDDGQQVRQGDLLVLLEQAEERASVSAAEAVLAERKAAFGRSSKLQQQQFSTAAQLDERRAALQQAEADLEIARARLQDRTILAPFDGVMGLRNVSVGTLVQPGDPIATLSDLSPLKLDFAVPSSFLTALKPGLAIEARSTALPDRTFDGLVKSVESTVDPVTRSITVRAVVPNDDGALRPGLVMTVALLKNPRQALVVPEEALVPYDRRNFVFVVAEEAGRTVARRLQVEPGARRPGEVEILKGLAEGRQVVVQGTLKLEDGDAVRLLGTESEDNPVPAILKGKAGG